MNSCMYILIWFHASDVRFREASFFIIVIIIKDTNEHLNVFKLFRSKIEVLHTFPRRFRP